MQTTNARRNREPFFAGVILSCGMAGKYPLPRPTKDFLFTIFDLRGHAYPATSA
jgi:hypothetical protein